MRMWIDCEFNEFGGQLISLAMVTEDGREWYQSIHCPKPTPWLSGIHTYYWKNAL